MTENQTDRLKQLEDVMAELQELRNDPPIKSMIVVQTDKPLTDQIQQSSPTKLWRADRRIVFAIGALMLVAVLTWWMRGHGSKHNAAVSVADDRLAQLKNAASQAATGDAAVALRQVEMLTDADCTPDELLIAASAFAAASARPTEDRVLAEHRAARAVLFLRRGFHQGLIDANALKNNLDLAPLLNRRDFRQLTADMSPR
jgi:hypothetical protein